MLPVNFAGIVGTDQVGMVQSANGLHFALESGNGLGVACPSRTQQLHGNRSFKVCMVGFVHGAHATLTDTFQQSVLPEGLGQAVVMHRLLCRDAGNRGLRLRPPKLAAERLRPLQSPFQLRAWLIREGRQLLLQVANYGVFQTVQGL